MMKKKLTDDALDLIASRFRILSDPMRLKILHALGETELTVTELVAATNGLQANISKHLGYLLDAGIVSRRKEGLNAYYKVADDSIFALCEVVCNRLDEQFSQRQRAVKSYMNT
jgi:ArsR family transcriptional regulator